MAGDAQQLGQVDGQKTQEGLLYELDRTSFLSVFRCCISNVYWAVWSTNRLKLILKNLSCRTCTPSIIVQCQMLSLKIHYDTVAQYIVLPFSFCLQLTVHVLNNR